PAAIVPVVLSKTPMPVLTICTYWVAPTAPLGSGGAQPQKLAGSPAPRPRPPKLSPVVPASGPPGVVWATGSGSTGPAWWPGRRSGRSGDPLYAVAAGGRSRSGRVTSCSNECETSGIRPNHDSASRGVAAGRPPTTPPQNAA